MPVSHYMNKLALRAFDLYLAAILDFLTMLLGQGKFAKGVGKDHFLSWDYLRAANFGEGVGGVVSLPTFGRIYRKTPRDCCFLQLPGEKRLWPLSYDVEGTIQ